jgi:hypothetical protein
MTRAHFKAFCPSVRLFLEKENFVQGAAFSDFGGKIKIFYENFLVSLIKALHFSDKSSVFLLQNSVHWGQKPPITSQKLPPKKPSGK